MSGFSINGVDEVLTRLGDPTSDTLADISDKFGDLARSLDLMLGSKWDAAGDLGSDITTILTSLGAGSSITGTADSGTVGTLVDSALTQSADFFIGQELRMDSGNNTGLSRTIVDFDDATDTVYVEPDFPSAVAAGDDYAIVPSSEWADILIGNNNADNAADTSLVVANADGSLLERAEYLQDEIGTFSADLTSIESKIDIIDTNVDDIETLLGTVDGKIDTIDTNVDSILTDTAEIGVAGAGLTEAGGTGDQFTALPWNAAWDAEVQSEVADALAAYDPPTDTEMDTRFDTVDADIATVDGVVDNIEDYVDGTTATPTAYRREIGVRQVIIDSITVAANSAATTIFTVAGAQAIIVESVVLYAASAQTADLTSCNVTGGDTGDEVSFLRAITQAQLDDASKQAAWTGAAYLTLGDVILFDPTGTGATALDLKLAVTYHAVSDGGYLS